MRTASQRFSHGQDPDLCYICFINLPRFPCWLRYDAEFFFGRAASKYKKLVYTYRAKDTFRDTVGGGVYSLMLDGQEVGKFRKHTYLPISVPPGKHRFEYRIARAYGMPGMSGALNGILDDKFLEVDVEEGKTYFLSFGNPNFWLKLVDKAQALQELQDCQLAEKE